MEGVIGYVTMFAGNFAPKNWAFCQAQIINIQSNTALFSILGTTYGGNGTTTFGLPDLQSRTIVGAGTGPGLSSYVLGQKSGAETVTLTSGQMPAHAHSLAITVTPYSKDDTGNTSTPDAVFAINGSTGYSGTNNVKMAAFPVTLQMTTVGADTAYSTLPAYMGLNYVICMYGVFPARN